MVRFKLHRLFKDSLIHKIFNLVFSRIYIANALNCEVYSSFERASQNRKSKDMPESMLQKEIVKTTRSDWP